MKIRFIILTIFFIIPYKFAFAQYGVLKGKVLDVKNNEALFGVSVYFEGTTLGASTDSNGIFIINKIPYGKHTVTASFVGFKKKTMKVFINKNDTSFIGFNLNTDVLSLSEITVLGNREYTASSSLALRAFDFELRPRQTAQDMLTMAPGLFIAQHAGGGKAEQIFLRGFDADHGTDVNISVDGIPVNMVSHGHGQGYADLHFVIPETVKGLEIEKGPYFVENGDFSTAGAVKFETKDRLKNNSFSVEGGKFGAFRTLAMLKIPLESSQTSSFLAAEFARTDGYFDSEINFNRFNIFGKINSYLNDNSKLTFSISGFGAAWDATGQIPARAVKQGIISRFGSIDNSEGGTTQRTNLNLIYNSKINDAVFQTQVYLVDYGFKLFSNFTFFLNDPVNGDEIEQNDQRTIIGFKGSYVFNNNLNDLKFRTTIGTGFRADNIDVSLWHVKKRERLKPESVAYIQEKSMNIFAGEEIIFSSKIRMNLGLRGDYFIFDVEDQLKDSSHQDISGYRSQVILSPKANLVISPANDLDIFFNFGTSFHSNDARVVVSDQSKKTLPRAAGAEAGVRTKLLDKIFLSAAAWGLDLESEFVYIGDEGTTESSGATRRYGLDLSVRSQLFNWLWTDIDLNLSNGKFKDLHSGKDNIPLAPNLTSTGGLSARFQNGFEGSIRYMHIGSRPANEDNSVIAKGYTVFELFLGYKLQNFKLTFSVENLFDVKWNEAQFDTESRLNNEVYSVSELHFTPGTPRQLKASVTYLF